MHELSIAMSLLDLAEEEAEARGLHVVGIRLRLGPMSGVVPEALQSAYELAREGSTLANARLVIEPTPLIAHCPTCSADRELDSPSNLCCPICGTPTPEIISGRELELSGLEVADVEVMGGEAGEEQCPRQDSNL